MKRKKIIVALSGGVDSAVSAFLLKKRGFDVSAGYIRGYNVDGCQNRDLEDARKVSQYIGMPFYVFDFEKEYEKRVVNYMIDGYKNGITPNPDIVCNSQIKFGLFYDKAINDMGFDAVASGHYARVKNSVICHLIKNNCPKIYEGVDPNKDQSYFLWQVEYNKFKNLIFPIGGLYKPKVRMIAKKAKLPVAYKKDSQGVCFLGKFNFADFLKEHIKVKNGDIIDINGKKVGQHDGVWFYTMGQRHGFKNTSGVPFYVIKKDIDKNQLIVAYENDSRLYSGSVSIKQLNFLDNGTKAKFLNGENINVLARIRYRQPLMSATLSKIENVAVLNFNKKSELFPAVGQSAVFYNKKGRMLGGGIII